MAEIGRIHSVETFGTVDGPGIRFVLFMQGCALRCQFCHNPDSWSTSTGKEMTVEQVLKEVEPFLNYYKRSKGGITITGGEPTLQANFVAKVFKECKERWGLHTALDSSGFCEPHSVEELMKYTDLVLLDLKQIHPERHLELAGQPNDRILHFAEWLSERGKPVWIRHVLVPDKTDAEEDLTALGEFVGKLNNVQKLEILPYHTMGIYKWRSLGMKNPLEGTRTPTDEEVARAYQLIEKGRLLATQSQV